MVSCRTCLRVECSVPYGGIGVKLKNGDNPSGVNWPLIGTLRVVFGHLLCPGSAAYCTIVSTARE